MFEMGMPGGQITGSSEIEKLSRSSWNCIRNGFNGKLAWAMSKIWFKTWNESTTSITKIMIF